MKYKQLADTLRRQILSGVIAQGDRLPTEKDLSAGFRISRQTVRHALALLENEGLIQRRQGSGSYATPPSASPRSTQVAVVVTFLDDYIFPRVLHDAQGVLSQQGYSTAVYVTDNRVGTEREILQRLLEDLPAGLLVEGTKTALPNPNLDLYQQFQKLGVPIVFFHSSYPGLSGTPCVADDNFGGGYALAQHLMAQGHRRIGGLFKSDDIQGPQRYQGVTCALREMDLPIIDQGFCWYDTESRLHMVQHRDSDLLRHFITTRFTEVSAVVCYNDEIAHLLITHLLALGRRVPEDLAVVSFDNSYYSQIGPVRITSMRHRDHKTGQLAAQELLNLMQGSPGYPKVLGWELVVRESSVKNG